MNYSENFNYWWAATYQGKLNPTPIMEEAFKEVCYAAWSEQQKTIYALTDQLSYCEEKLSYCEIPSGIIGHTI
jgi:hypothetical protein